MFSLGFYDYVALCPADSSRLQPNVGHHLLVHCPGHGGHHGPPQRPRHGPSEETLQPVFLNQTVGRDQI